MSERDLFGWDEAVVQQEAKATAPAVNPAPRASTFGQEKHPGYKAFRDGIKNIDPKELETRKTTAQTKCKNAEQAAAAYEKAKYAAEVSQAGYTGAQHRRARQFTLSETDQNIVKHLQDSYQKGYMTKAQKELMATRPQDYLAKRGYKSTDSVQAKVNSLVNTYWIKEFQDPPRTKRVVKQINGVILPIILVGVLLTAAWYYGLGFVGNVVFGYILSIYMGVGVAGLIAYLFRRKYTVMDIGESTVGVIVRLVIGQSIGAKIVNSTLGVWRYGTSFWFVVAIVIGLILACCAGFYTKEVLNNNTLLTDMRMTSVPISEQEIYTSLLRRADQIEDVNDGIYCMTHYSELMNIIEKKTCESVLQDAESELKQSRNQEAALLKKKQEAEAEAIKAKASYKALKDSLQQRMQDVKNWKRSPSVADVREYEAANRSYRDKWKDDYFPGLFWYQFPFEGNVKRFEHRHDGMPVLFKVENRHPTRYVSFLDDSVVPVRDSLAGIKRMTAAEITRITIVDTQAIQNGNKIEDSIWDTHKMKIELMSYKQAQGYPAPQAVYAVTCDEEFRLLEQDIRNKQEQIRTINKQEIERVRAAGRAQNMATANWLMDQTGKRAYLVYDILLIFVPSDEVRSGNGFDPNRIRQLIGNAANSSANGILPIYICDYKKKIHPDWLSIVNDLPTWIVHFG